MKGTLYVSSHCPESQEVLSQCRERGLDFRIIDITEDLSSLKEFMNLRENEDFFKKAKEENRVGIPVFVFGDNEFFYDAEEKVDWEILYQYMKK
ncbi:MAG: hypothetical protein Q4Q07_05735 [Tissierellia bacterium]|nr:hypothetical protein [Tissierellia bacterium]